MPLVLKDGRIANVTVHAIPFDNGESELDPAIRASLRSMFEPLATDCFLTAQAIGHVAPGITRDGDTLSAHRLARARADTIQAALAGFGMPQPSVASVWDWQFLLQKSQVTLWVFSLTRGDDCEGTPLAEGERAVAAGEDETTAVAADTPPTTGATARHGGDEAPEASAMVAASVQADPGASETARTTSAASAEADAIEAARAEPQQPGPVAEPDDAEASEPVVAAPSELVAADPLATAAVAPADSASRPAAPASEAADASTTVAAIDPEEAVGVAGESALTITFDMNSSYFPSGAGRELRAFLDSLPPDVPVEIELSGAVGNSAVRGASGEEARRYNAWMAERRIERVLGWLEQNADNRQITFAEQLVENDPSRQVRLRATISR